jgi:release factor glutamine methyltransferase
VYRSGSGCAITFLSLLLNSTRSCQFIATDINPHATALTKRTAVANGVVIDIVQTSLLSGLDEQLNNKIDVLLFNPPYVPTPDEEVGGIGIEASWAGGANGRVVIDQFIAQITVSHSVIYCTS